MIEFRLFFACIALAVLASTAQNAWAGSMTVGTLHDYCLELPDAKNAARGDLKSVAGGVHAIYLQGYIAGVTDEMAGLAGVGLDFDWPKTNGEIVVAVCQYFALHPEQWSWEAASGVHLAAAAMYKKKGK
jgi:hypothetical protein